jgi:hypothetical protein
MSSLRKRFWLAELLLPAILFRALIPVGFMPAIDADGRIGVFFCPITVSAAPGTALAHHHGHGGGNAGSAGSGHHQLACPFAASTGLAPLPAVLAPAVAPADFLPPATGNSTQRFIPTIIRAQSPRAPPPGVA